MAHREVVNGQGKEEIRVTPALHRIYGTVTRMRQLREEIHQTLIVAPGRHTE